MDILGNTMPHFPHNPMLKQALIVFHEMLNWRVAVDIAMIALVFFSIYRFLKDTGTWKILLGILAAGLFFMVARLLDLKGIQWIYSALSPVIAIAVIIIFQPEIRRMLEKTASIYKRQPQSMRPESARLIGEVAFHLSDLKRGALIVLPGGDSLQSHVSHGIPLDGVPSLPLLSSIFDPHSGGHDGAVIIENHRVSRFAVRLPLSKRGRLSEEFGMRHHAALGLAEATDALVIVVSEERGTVTLFSAGNMFGLDSMDALSSKITEHLRRNTRYPFVAKDKRTKKTLAPEILGCFVMAVLFWISTVR